MTTNDFVVTAAAVFAIPMQRDAPGFTAKNAPDALSKRILGSTVESFDDGASGPGDIPVAIARHLPWILEQNLARMTPEAAMTWLDGMGDVELEHLAWLYVDGCRLAQRPGLWLQVAALRLDTVGLMRLSSFFGYEPVHEATLIAAPEKAPALAAGCTIRYPTPPAAPGTGPHAADIARTDLPLAANDHAVAISGTTPSVTKTIRQLYIGFRSLHSGSAAAVAAIYETAGYCGEHLVATWGTGFYFGSQISGLMQLYAPDWYRDKFAPGVGAPLDYLQSLVLTIGKYYPKPKPSPLAPASERRGLRLAFVNRRRS